MNYTISPINEDDRKSIIDLFNYYVENSFAAYPETNLSYEAFDMFLQISRGYPTVTVKDNNQNLVGFGLLRVHNPMSTFSQTAEVTYFVNPEHTGKGIGKRMLNYLEEEGKRKGITNILANISSLNPNSIEFHKKNGFTEVGRFKGVCRKKGQVFDTVWMQKTL